MSDELLSVREGREGGREGGGGGRRRADTELKTKTHTSMWGTRLFATMPVPKMLNNFVV